MITLAKLTTARVSVSVMAPDAYDPPDAVPVVMALDMLDRGPLRPYGFRRFAQVVDLPAPLPAELDSGNYLASCEFAAEWLRQHGPAVVAGLR